MWTEKPAACDSSRPRCGVALSVRPTGGKTLSQISGSVKLGGSNPNVNMVFVSLDESSPAAGSCRRTAPTGRDPSGAILCRAPVHPELWSRRGRGDFALVAGRSFREVLTILAYQLNLFRFYPVHQKAEDLRLFEHRRLVTWSSGL